ncbi:MAG TPA: branched-chain amino acid ABC transporter substrate-binding protein, partial [Ottowia sp.]|nr:branched-chain amino acid ABC transporter substrate-binding protein [Ottowia sp.]
MQLQLKLTVAAALMAAFGMASAQEQVVKIGSVAPMSGGQAHYGKDNANGVIMAVEALNKQGITIGGKKIKWEAQ